jgi:hypothetical protein
MPDFLNRFADQKDENGKLAFSNWKSGLIVALVYLDGPSYKAC